MKFDMWGFVGLLVLLSYICFSCSLYVITGKTGNKNKAWMALIPVLDVLLMFRIANKPMWCSILIFVPVVGFVVIVVVWARIGEARNKPNWLGILILVPFVNLIIPAYFAFGD